MEDDDWGHHCIGDDEVDGDDDGYVDSEGLDHQNVAKSIGCESATGSS